MNRTAIKMSGSSSITINGVTCSGTNVSVIDGVVYIDGVRQGDAIPDQRIEIVVNGDAHEIETSSGNVTVKGIASSVSTQSGDVTIYDQVQGSVSTMSGSVRCGPVTGRVTTMSGAISHGC